LKLKKFFVIIFELAIILKLYDWLARTTGLSIGSYLFLCFILFWILNYLLGKLSLARPVSSTLFFKILPRMAFTNEWFGVFVLIAVSVGFFLSKFLLRLPIGGKFLTFLMVLAGAITAYKIFTNKKISMNQDKSLWVAGFVFGIAIGTEFTSNWFIITIFVLGSIFLYLLSEPEERECMSK